MKKMKYFLWSTSSLPVTSIRSENIFLVRFFGSKDLFFKKIKECHVISF